MERIPFQATDAAYENIRALPVSILLDNVRSMYNVGAFFRTADAAGIEKLYLCGITSHPPKKAISKTALGAEERARRGFDDGVDPFEKALVAHDVSFRTSMHAVDLFDWKPRFPVCLVFGHEVEGIRPEIAERCDTHVRIPMLGIKHSLNVATAGGVAIYELLRKYRELQRPRYLDSL